MAKALSLLSGGLDSILALRLLLEQKIEVEAIYFKSVFFGSGNGKRTSYDASKAVAECFDVPFKVFEITKEHIEIIRNPKYGFGKNLNPCIDCHAFMIKKAGEYMRESGASFVATGEVLGERPMSQRRYALRVVERESGLDGLLLRPLSAKLLKPTTPEKEGIIDREKLLAIKGRSRRPQIELAKKFGIEDFLTPSGGCLLTYQGFSDKVKDLMRHKKDMQEEDIEILKAGRYFRISKDCFFVVGRNQKQNDRLEKLAKENDLHFEPKDTTGPVGIGRGSFDDSAIKTASSLIGYYSDCDNDKKIKIYYNKIAEEDIQVVDILPATEKDVISLRI